MEGEDDNVVRTLGGFFVVPLMHAPQNPHTLTTPGQEQHVFGWANDGNVNRFVGLVTHSLSLEETSSVLFAEKF